jgi:hypothetical protein
MTARLGAAAALDDAIRERIGDAGLHELHSGLAAIGEISMGTTEFDPANAYRSPRLW